MGRHTAEQEPVTVQRSITDPRLLDRAAGPVARPSEQATATVPRPVAASVASNRSAAVRLEPARRGGRSRRGTAVWSLVVAGAVVGAGIVLPATSPADAEAASRTIVPLPTALRSIATDQVSIVHSWKAAKPSEKRRIRAAMRTLVLTPGGIPKTWTSATPRQRQAVLAALRIIAANPKTVRSAWTSASPAQKRRLLAALRVWRAASKQHSTLVASATVPAATAAMSTLLDVAALLSPSTAASPSAAATTANPPTLPSAIPSAVPSILPSAIPSALPSALPSVLPSVLPSALPSALPPAIQSAPPSAIPSTPPVPSPSTTASSPAPTASPSNPVGQVAPTVVGSLSPLVRALASGQALTLGSGIYTLADFGSDSFGAVLSGGIVGTGESSTVIEMSPNTSTRAGAVPTASGTTNPLHLLRVQSGSPTLRDFTLQGTPQGHQYNGMQIMGTTGAQVSNVRVNAIPGDSNVNPGETFGINDFHTTNSRYTGVEIDGAGVGASALAFNSSANPTIADSSFHDNPFSAGMALWQTRDATISDVVMKGNKTGLNLERTSGTITVVRPTFQGNRSQDLYIGSDRESVQVRIIDPVFSGKIRINVPANYWAGTQQQRRSDIKVIINGVDRTDSVVQWI